ncbi:hypothetical protein B0H14DRAFT_3580658 [Mycena olivaceomarginata]|nr:hypothetical protein B0H14DRAFT_3580658 [Mycena olivaceomarginata]
MNAVDVGWEGFDDVLLRSPWAFANTIKGAVPRSYQEAMRESQKWMPAMQAEIDQLEARGVWKLVDLPEGERAIEGMWVYDVKVDGEGKVLKNKERGTTGLEEGAPDIWQSQRDTASATRGAPDAYSSSS